MIHEIINDIRKKVFDMNVRIVEDYIRIEEDEEKKAAAKRLLNDLITIHSRMLISLHNMQMSNKLWDRDGDVIADMKEALEKMKSPTLQDLNHSPTPKEGKINENS
jgi:hypothetical protein